MSSEPIFGAIVVPNELNACTKVSVADSLPGFASRVTYGLPETCNRVTPEARMKSAPKKVG